MRADRGQAIFETVLFMPLFLIALVGIMWAVQAGVQSERAASTVRYNGLISLEQNPYADYSLNAMYGQLAIDQQLGYTALQKKACTTPIAAPLTDAAPTFTAGTSGLFWSPSSSDLFCIQYGAAYYGIIGIAAGTGLNQDVLLRDQGSEVLLNVAPIGPLQRILGTTLQHASGTFFKTVGIDVILACYPSLDTQITSSLEYTTDTSAATMPAQLSSTVTALTPGLNSDCTDNYTW
jgi:hypothetical protein